MHWGLNVLRPTHCSCQKKTIGIGLYLPAGAFWSHSVELYIDGKTSFELNSAQAGPEEDSGWGGTTFLLPV